MEFHQFGLVRQQFFISVIPQNIAVAIIDTVIHGCLLTAFDTDGGLAAFVLGKGGHDGEPKLTIAVEGLDTVIDEVDLYNIYTVIDQGLSKRFFYGQTGKEPALCT